MKILVLDDSKIMLRIISNALKRIKQEDIDINMAIAKYVVKEVEK